MIDCEEALRAICLPVFVPFVLGRPLYSIILKNKYTTKQNTKYKQTTKQPTNQTKTFGSLSYFNLPFRNLRIKSGLGLHLFYSLWPELINDYSTPQII